MSRKSDTFKEERAGGTKSLVIFCALIWNFAHGDLFYYSFFINTIMDVSFFLCRIIFIKPSIILFFFNEKLTDVHTMSNGKTTSQSSMCPFIRIYCSELLLLFIFGV